MNFHLFVKPSYDSTPWFPIPIDSFVHDVEQKVKAESWQSNCFQFTTLERAKVSLGEYPNRRIIWQTTQFAWAFGKKTRQCTSVTSKQKEHFTYRSENADDYYQFHGRDIMVRISYCQKCWEVLWMNSMHRPCCFAIAIFKRFFFVEATLKLLQLMCERSIRQLPSLHNLSSGLCVSSPGSPAL